MAQAVMEALMTNSARGVVFVVDDDTSMRKALQSLLRASGFEVRTFENVTDFLAYARPAVPACLVLDVRMPGTSGLDLQRMLAGTEADIPVIFITAHADIETSVRAMKGGALEFFTKPFSDRALLDAIARALDLDAGARKDRADLHSLKSRYDTLTTRERQVMDGIVQGLLNKQVANALDVSEITVKVHRRHIMEKMNARSFAELVRMAEKLAPDTSRSR